MELRLTARQRASLEAVVARPEDVRQLKRAQGLLAVAEGIAVVEIARRLAVCRDTIYAWVARFRERSEAIAERLRDRPRCGRPDELFQKLLARLAQLMETTPGTFGYRHAEWTVGLLQAQLACEQIHASGGSIRRALHALGYRWKRPRYVLSRRSVHWRQSKGGCSVV
jgi:transposase